jgi:hypothetical protein
MIKYLINSVVLILVVFLLASCATTESKVPMKNQSNDINERIYSSAWANFSKLTTKFDSDSKTWEIFTLERYENEDFRIDVKNANNEGTILMIGGKFMLVKGLDLKSGYEIDAVDGPVIMMMATIHLLYHAFPNGPPTQPMSYPINIVNKKDSINVYTMSAHGEWLAPWSMEGTLNSIDPKHLTFDLSAKFKNWDSLKVSGEWIDDRKQLSYPDESALNGWKVLTIGVQHRVYDKNGKLIKEEGPSSPLESCKTIGDLRHYLKDSIPGIK